MYQETSREAYLSVVETLSAVRQDVYRHLYEAGRRGLTQEEIIAKFPGLDQSTPRREVSHLEDLGLVVDSGRRRTSSRGRRQIVWVASTVPATPPQRCTLCGTKLRHK